MFSLISHALLLVFFVVYLGNIVTTSKQYSESGMGSGQKIDNKTIPVGMNVNFRIPFFSFCFFAFCYMFYVCVCLWDFFYCFPAIKLNTTITLNICIAYLSRKRNNEKKN